MTHPAVNEKDLTDRSEKLNRLDEFLASDPSNAPLLIDVFELALSTGQYERAEQYVVSAMTQNMDARGWRFRSASLRLAQKRLEEAREMFCQLQVEEGFHPMISYKLATIEFMREDYQACVDILDPWMHAQSASDLHKSLVEQLESESLAALQVLWLRALHRQGELARAWLWLEEQRAQQTLTSAAAGIACVVAVDFGRSDHEVEELAQLANGHPGSGQEVHLSLGTVLLGKQDAAGARQQLAQALRLNDANGRVWSTLGFTELLDQHAAQAVQNFERSVQLMPKHVGTWIGLGWARLLADQKTDGAKKAFMTALELDHNFAESHGCLATVLALEGSRQQAQHHIELADRLDRSNMAARYAQLILNGEATDSAAVRRLARKLLLARAQRPEVWVPDDV